MKKTHIATAALAAILSVGGFAISTTTASAASSGELTWSGIVDDTAIISIHGDQVRTENAAGNGVYRTRTQMYGRIPHARTDVRLTDRHGRGFITVIQQPCRENDYTAKVRIQDPQSSDSRYRFTLEWYSNNDRDRDRDRDRDWDRDHDGDNDRDDHGGHVFHGDHGRN